MFDRLIANATAASPLTLADFLFEVDRRQRVVPTLEELRDLVDQLFYEGKLLELAPGEYVRNPDPATLPPYTRVDEALYDAAWERMQRWHEEARQQRP